MKQRFSGQALLESIAGLAVLALLSGWAVPTLWQTLDARQRKAELSRNVLWQLPSPALDDQAAVSHDAAYHAAEQLAGVLTPLQRYSKLALPVHNLRQLHASERFFPMARLTDSWSPHQQAALNARPQQLVPLYHLQQLGLAQVLQGISWLPVATEFHPARLRLGWLDSDVVPESAICMGASC